MFEGPIEVGKYYRLHDKADGPEDKRQRVIMMLGRVDQNTLEYKSSYRFYDTSGRMYKDNGRRCLHGPGNDDIISEASDDDLLLYRNKNKIFFLHECDRRQIFIPYDHEHFRMAIGLFYVNRMGLLDRITSASVKPKGRPQGIWTSRNGYDSFHDNGRVWKSTTTMYDLMYQITSITQAKIYITRRREYERANNK